MSDAPRRFLLPTVAAAGMIAAGVGIWLALRADQSPEPAAEPVARMIATGIGVRDSVRLPDGTRVMLGPLSAITVAIGYGESRRDVELRGDGYFEVIHDEARPFTVQAGNATIRDVGTKFAIRSDSGDDVAVSISEGSVSLRPVSSTEENGVLLHAGDRALLSTDGKVVHRPATVTNDDLAWMQGRLVFRETPLREVISPMQRWYGMKLGIADSSLTNRRLTATFSGQPPQRILEVLRLALGVEIERRGDSAIVRAPKGNTRSR